MASWVVLFWALWSLGALFGWDMWEPSFPEWVSLVWPEQFCIIAFPAVFCGKLEMNLVFLFFTLIFACERYPAHIMQIDANMETHARCAEAPCTAFAFVSTRSKNILYVSMFFQEISNRTH